MRYLFAAKGLSFAHCQKDLRKTLAASPCGQSGFLRDYLKSMRKSDYRVLLFAKSNFKTTSPICFCFLNDKRFSIDLLGALGCFFLSARRPCINRISKFFLEALNASRDVDKTLLS